MAENDENMNKGNNDQGDGGVISDTTPVRIGLIVGFLAIFGSAIWWGATITSKLDSIISLQSSQSVTFTELKAKDVAIDKELSDMKLNLAIIDVALKSLSERVSANSSKLSQ